MYGSPFGYGGAGLGLGFGLGPQDPYGYGNQGLGFGQQGLGLGGYQANNNIDIGSKLGALQVLGNILEQIGNM